LNIAELNGGYSGVTSNNALEYIFEFKASFDNLKRSFFWALAESGPVK
jgi:hypothetical protein